MYFVRVSLLVPAQAATEETSRVQKELMTFFAAQEGFVDGYYLEAADESGVVGRVTVWQSEEQADRVATDNHCMALRSALLRLVDRELVAQGFQAARVPKT